MAALFVPIILQDEIGIDFSLIKPSASGYL